MGKYNTENADGKRLVIGRRNRNGNGSAKNTTKKITCGKRGAPGVKITFKKNKMIVTHPTDIVQEITTDELRWHYEDLQDQIGDLSEQRLIIATNINDAELASS